MDLNLLLEREPTVYGTTFGTLYINGVQNCSTLEPPVRELARLANESAVEWVARWKVQDQTAIPADKYEIEILPSPKFGNRMMPHLQYVPDFMYVMVHPLNVVLETDGCVGVGIARGTIGGRPALLESKMAFDPLLKRISDCKASGGRVWIDIHNPLPMASAALDVDAAIGG